MAESVRCSFCHKHTRIDGLLISTPAGVEPKSYICDECIDICVELIDEHRDGSGQARIDQANQIMFYVCFGFSIHEAIEYVTAQ